MSTATVGEGLDEHRTVAGANGIQAGPGHGVHGDDVVAVDAQAGNAETFAALAQWCRSLDVGGFRDGPLVVLAEEQHRCVEGSGEGQRLRDIALRGGSVAEAGDGCSVAFEVTGADVAVHGHAHRVSGGVQGLRADDDRVRVEAVFLRVPTAVVLASEHAEESFRFDSASVGEAVFAIGGEDEVLGASRPAHPDLSCFLTEHRRPEAELSLALQGRTLSIDATHQDHVPVEAAQILIGEFCCEGVIFTGFDAIAVFGEHLDHPRFRRLTVGSPGSH